MKLEKWSPNKKVISTVLVLVILTLSVSIVPVSAANRDNDAIRIYEALTSVDTSTTEFVYMPCRGESMYPTIETGDRVKVQFYTDGSSIDVGDVIVYHSWMVGAFTNGMWIGHRVTKKYRQGDLWYFRTKGDNCPEPDSWEVPESAILGKIVSTEHTENSYTPTKPSSNTERSYTAYPKTAPSLSQGSETVLLIIISLCLGIASAIYRNSGRREEQKTSGQPVRYALGRHRELVRRQQRIRRMQELQRRQHSTMQKAANVNGKTLVETWRKSVVGLIRLAEENLAVARHHLETKDCEASVKATSTGVENIARALIHCYGGKPDPNQGQEEALRILSQRFKGEQRAQFERAVDSLARISHNTIALRYISKHNVQIQLLDETKAKQILESALGIVHLFKQILTDHFVAEIPELRYGTCANCHSLNISVAYFTERRVRYQCNNCRNSWTEPRL